MTIKNAIWKRVVILDVFCYAGVMAVPQAAQALTAIEDALILSR